ncbi:hypothetical protein STRCI_001300 [Streptomyces cinnabarinus]|uniref:Uncharacterized protein n=1 Tax=Streptomyces cinnabarinus TaxID=67287 RepID=A0ABY7K8T8_9ACTN|nr:hypothetical protein [Streptomyces cinnabarinus]WAZ20200.1 hypothetical protein STRCI_001300 [Streptomyces cinnabarinus]
MHVIIKPGSEPVPLATERQAAHAAAVFVLDLCGSLQVVGAARTPESDRGQGWYAFTLTMADGRAVVIQMPGLPLDQVRYMDDERETTWDPRLYVNGRALVWRSALAACQPDVEDGGE